MHFQHSVVKLRRDFRAIGIFRQGEAASESTKGSLDAMEFLFEIFFLGFAFPGNAKDAVFDSYPNVILLHFRQVSFEQIPAIIFANINLRRPICDCQAVDLATAHSIRQAAQEERIEAILCRLVHLYERRSEGPIPFGQGEQAVLPPGGINHCDWLRALAQLSEYHLIDWTPVEDQSGMGLLSGFAKINDFGVKVLEGGVAAPISISIDKSWRTTVPRRQIPTAPSTAKQQQVIMEALEKVITAINQADVSEQEKNEAKTLLRRLLGGKAALSVLGPGAQSIAAKYFTE